MCKGYSAFPQNGGLEAQDMTALARFESLAGLYRVCMTFNTGGWKALSSADKAVIAEIAELEYERANRSTNRS